MAQAAGSITIQLNSATAEKGTGEHYVMPLDPPIRIPYLARPRAQLEGLCFSNVFPNLSAAIGNNTLKLVWYSHKVGQADETDWQTMTIVLGDGFYDIPRLESELAKQIRAQSTSTYTYETHKETLGASLWSTMNTYCAANPGYETADVSATNTVYFDCGGVIKAGTGSGYEFVEAVAADKVILPVKASTLQLWRKKHDKTATLATEPPEWLIGSTLLALPSNATNTLKHDGGAGPDKGGLTVGAKIVAVHKFKTGQNSIVYATGGGSETKSTDAEWGIELSTAGTATTAIFDAGFVQISFTPVGGADGNYRGYGVKSLARPSLDTDSGWGAALNAQDIDTILRTAGAQANNVVVGATAATLGLEQYDRYVKPVTIGVEPGTNKLRCHFAWPGVYVCKGSTLFTGLLGYSDDQLVTQSDPVESEYSKQNPFCNSTQQHAAAVADRTTIQSSSEILVTRLRQLNFNCPTLVSATYGTDGKLSQAQMASVPVLVGQNEIQNYQAQYDNSVPCDLHGADINAIDFYLTDQTGAAIDLQKSTFQATLRIYYPDPIHPKIGEAGAEQDDTIGIRDVTFRY